MKRNNMKKYLYYSGFVFIVCCSIFSGTAFNEIAIYDSVLIQESLGDTQKNFDLELKTSSLDNYETIESIFSQKLTDYSQLGYFPQYYESSLQATYYALYILNALERLDQIDQANVLDYILSYYNEETHIFMDKYSYRYLDTIFPRQYNPYSSVLQVNCYAIQSLAILNRLYLIDIQDSIDFIWSCFNPEGTENGFLGQPYDPTLSYGFKTATMDNSFFAITTLNLLMSDWGGHDSELASLVNYINRLQEDLSTNDDLGGFYNDLDPDLYSLAMYGGVNLLASYYSIKTLNTLELVDTIQTNNFHQYLTHVYDPNNHYFKMYDWDSNIYNLVGTALGLELADITGFSGFDKTEVVDFILSNRKTPGNWDSSTEYNNHELIDTFQIVRSLKEIGIINQLNSQEKSEIVSSLELYRQFEGYSLLSNDYTSLNLIYTIVNSFVMLRGIAELNISGLYDMIESSYKGEYDTFGFIACLNLDQRFTNIRSRPIEYYSNGEHRYTNITGALIDHKRNYMALDSLIKLYKLDDFDNQYNLMNIFNNIIDSQYLNDGYDNFGAFHMFKKVGTPEYQNNFIFFEYSYYAVKTLELLSNYLGLGPLVNLPFNKMALQGYIERNIIETNTTLYFNPQFTTDPYVTLKYTYYMAYILKALNVASLNLNKITQFVLGNMDYDNILKLYYCYKISDLLNLNIEFDLDAAQNIVANLFSDEYYEFFINSEFQELDQESFLWICDLAVSSEFVVNSDYEDSIILGGINTITTSFCNMIFPEYGTDIIVKFESPTLGVFELDRQSDTTYQANIMVPEKTENFPFINGSLKAYKNTAVIGETPVFFRTSLNQIVTPSYKKEANKISFEINITRALISGDHPVSNSHVFVDLFKENTYIETLQLHRKHFANHSTFTLKHEISSAGTYTYNFSIVDEFYTDGFCLFTSQHKFSPPDLLSLEMNGFILGVIGLTSSASVVGVTTNVGNRVKRRRSRKIIEPEQKTSAREIIEDIEEALYNNLGD
ncbi:MAG: hypothetical protein HWN80_19190 [Candidatus Lokiarchaeota archaeon]|nr:hypothetical protein [Candidatus Lokiarchaeota archaeon]